MREWIIQVQAAQQKAQAVQSAPAAVPKGP